jgi:hypothetical protein
MQAHMSQLADINKRLEDAIHHLREQQALMPEAQKATSRLRSAQK